MLVRLILVLLLAAFALPGAAPAACHDAPAVGHAMPMPSNDSDRHALPVHACIGCIPPSDWLSPRIVVPVRTAKVVLHVGPAPTLVGFARSPDPRPPRRG